MLTVIGKYAKDSAIPCIVPRTYRAFILQQLKEEKIHRLVVFYLDSENR